jgi:hypothetical protein
MAKDRKGREFASLAEACTYAVRRAPGLLRKILRLDANTYLSTEISDGERTPLSGGCIGQEDDDKSHSVANHELSTVRMRPEDTIAPSAEHQRSPPQAKAYRMAPGRHLSARAVVQNPIS